MTRAISSTELRDAVRMHREMGVRAAARALSIPESTLRHRLKVAVQSGIKDEFEVAPLPSGQVALSEIFAYRRKRLAAKRSLEKARSLIPVKVKIEGPIGVLHFGDPHIDDDGTDLDLLFAHARLVRETQGLFAANVGDSTNNWVGRLAHLYSDQSTTESEGFALAEAFVKAVGDWLYVIGGNHDMWSGAGDPLKWIMEQANALYQDSEVRLELQLPYPVRINARHDFKGSSQWNPVHAPMKALQLGVRDHIAVCGHKHQSGYSVLKCPDSKITMHALQIGSYKELDRYARTEGFKDQSLGPAVVTTINTAIPDTHPDAIKVWWDPFEGADYLSFLRRKHK